MMTKRFIGAFLDSQPENDVEYARQVCWDEDGRAEKGKKSLESFITLKVCPVLKVGFDMLLQLLR